MLLTFFMIYNGNLLADEVVDAHFSYLLVVIDLEKISGRVWINLNANNYRVLDRSRCCEISAAHSLNSRAEGKNYCKR